MVHGYCFRDPVNQHLSSLSEAKTGIIKDLGESTSDLMLSVFVRITRSKRVPSCSVISKTFRHFDISQLKEGHIPIPGLLESFYLQLTNGWWLYPDLPLNP